MPIEEFAKENIRKQVPGIRDEKFFRSYLEARWASIAPAEQELNADEKPYTWEDFYEGQRVNNHPGFLPDMFYIDSEIRCFYLYEIEDTHPLTKAKLDRLMVWIANQGDEITQWFGRVIVTDRYGLNHRIVLSYEDTSDCPNKPYENLFPRVFRPLNQPASNG